MGWFWWASGKGRRRAGKEGMGRPKERARTEKHVGRECENVCEVAMLRRQDD